jgi:UDP-N-acetylmuramoyl-tripeptide--D-alanyl-D-alanine ligase
MARRAPGRAVLYGTMPDCEVHIGEVVLDPMARPAFRLGTPWGSFDVRLAASGAHMAENAAAALSCVGVLGLDVAAGVDALRTASITPMRMEVRRLASGAVLVDDSYNANPVSMRAALDALAAVPATRRVAVLGVMAELADPSGDHREIAAYAKARGIDVIAVGTDLYGTAPVPDPLDALWSLSGGDAVLVKASRAAQLDRVAAALVAREGLVVEH